MVAVVLVVGNEDGESLRLRCAGVVGALGGLDSCGDFGGGAATLILVGVLIDRDVALVPYQLNFVGARSNQFC